MLRRYAARRATPAALGALCLIIVTPRRHVRNSAAHGAQVERPLLELATTAVNHELTLLLAWSAAEAARYLETFKVRRSRPISRYLAAEIDGTWQSRAVHLVAISRCALGARSRRDLGRRTRTSRPT